MNVINKNNNNNQLLQSLNKIEYLWYLWLGYDGFPPLSLPQQTPLSPFQALLINLHLSQDHLKNTEKEEISFQ